MPWQIPDYGNYKFKIQIINKKKTYNRKPKLLIKLFIRKESETKDEKLITLKRKK